MLSNPCPLLKSPRLFCDTIIERHRQTGIDPAAIATALLPSFSLAAASLVEVEVEPGFVIPPVIFAQVIAESGFGKSILDGYATGEFKKYEKECVAAEKSSQGFHKGEQIVWEEKKKALLAKLRKEFSSGGGTRQVEQEIKLHETSRPIDPVADRLLLSDATPEAAKKHFAGIRKTGGIFVPEGSVGYKDGRIFSEPGLLCNVWDGTSFHVDRAVGGSVACIDPAAAMLIFAQPHIFQKFNAKHGEDMRSIGLYPRTLFYIEDQNRNKWDFSYYVHDKHCLEAFDGLIRTMLDQRAEMMKSPVASKRRLKASPEAQQLYHLIKQQLKMDALPTRPLEKFKDFAAKYTNNMMRIACLFHLMEGREGDISRDSVENANAWCHWYLQQAMMYFDENKMMEEKAYQLYDWINQKLAEWNVAYIEKTTLYQCATNKLRGKAKIAPLVDFLVGKKMLATEKIRGVGVVVRKFDATKDFGF